MFPGVVAGPVTGLLLARLLPARLLPARLLPVLLARRGAEVAP